MKANKKSIVIENRKVSHNFFIEDTYECGIELRGNEVKSIRSGMASIKEAWVEVKNGHAVLKQMHITKFETANRFDVDENRERNLLLHKCEIDYIERQSQLQGYTVMPIKVYFNDNGKCKVLIALCKGKHNYDKRETEKKKQMQRDIERSLR